MAPQSTGPCAGPLLTGLAQGAYQGLDLVAAQGYTLVKVASLDFLDMSEEMCHHRFWMETYPRGAWPLVVAQNLLLAVAEASGADWSSGG